MKIVSTLSRFARSSALALQASAAALAAWSGSAVAQTPSILGSLPPGVVAQLQSDPKYRQWRYFYRQRAFPHDRIAPGAAATVFNSRRARAWAPSRAIG
jgi:hypothetical protein